MFSSKFDEVYSVTVGAITFVCAYIYCINEYGFLLGFGLGWIPSLMLAYIAPLLLSISILVAVVAGCGYGLYSLFQGLAQ